mgnify:CR=1 FL=1
MAFTAYHNITGSTGVDVELIAPGEDIGAIRSIMVTNTHATADATVSLFIQNDPTAAAVSTFYILSTVAIPSDTSLLLDNSSVLSFDNSSNGYGLYLTVGSSDTLDVLINI